VIGVINFDTNGIDSYLFSIKKRVAVVSEVVDRLGVYREENETLKKENLDLLSKLSKLQSLEIENEKLKAQLNSKETTKENKVLASVTGMNNYLTPSEITINVGKSSGVTVGNAVVLNDFLVGKVSE
jgi:rod shape-determining protein MreC